MYDRHCKAVLTNREMRLPAGFGTFGGRGESTIRRGRGGRKGRG